MEKIEIKSWINGNVLFKYECDDNSILKTLQKALDSGVNLSYANLSGAYLRDAYLSGANLSYANLSDADLSDANLSDAYLSDADLRGADLRGVNLSGAYLSDANLSGANLRGAYLSGANLSYANLSGANLRGAYLSGAYLSDADLRGAVGLLPYYNFNSLSILKNQKHPITAYKYLSKDMMSPVQSSGKIEYKVGDTIEENNCDYDEFNHCSRGLNIATLEWCLRDTGGNTKDYNYIEVEFNPKDMVAIPWGSDGKFRVKRLKVIKILTQKELKKYITPIKVEDDNKTK